MDLVQQMRAERQFKKSRQEAIDEMMCRPGYTWNETLKKCLPRAVPGDYKSPPDLEKPPSDPPQPPAPPPEGEAPPPSPDQAIAKEAAKRRG